MVSLTGDLRELADKEKCDFHDIVRKYESWVVEDRFMVIAHERELVSLPCVDRSKKPNGIRARG
jgi:hypothetical protein